MTANVTADRPAGDRALVTAAEWLAGGRRVSCRPGFARRWNLAVIARELGGAVAITVAGSIEDPYEHRQIEAIRRRVSEAEVVTVPGGHLTTGEHPDLLALAVRDFAGRHGVGTPVAPHTDIAHDERKPA